MDRECLLEEGVNCWRCCKSERVTFLIDGADYFGTLLAAMRKARRSIFISGWDTDSGAVLSRGPQPEDLPRKLGELLDALCRRRPQLEVHIITWKMPPIFHRGHDPFPCAELGTSEHGRMHFAEDDDHPTGASLHQKLIVIDDSIAFVGGMDLADNRWDTPKHEPRDPRRVTAGCEAYPPVHDVQIAVAGPAARSFGELLRDRWRHLRGEVIPAPAGAGDAWPAELIPDLYDVDVGLVRTEPARERAPEIREVEQLYLDTIARARQYIYFEHQYFTSASVTEALRRRLAEPACPEIVLVLRRDASGWLEHTVMMGLRSRCLALLKEADVHGRLRIYYPALDRVENRALTVHSKVTIADGCLARVGSSNVSNRSMGLDTEYDLFVDANGNERARAGVERFLHRLLAEHLDVPIEEVQRVYTATRTVGGTIEELRGNRRTLVPMEVEAPGWLARMMPSRAPLDPDSAGDFEQMADTLVVGASPPEVRRRLTVLAALAAALVLISAYAY